MNTLMEGNVAPLFWLKGESFEILADGLAKLRSAGIFSCILEARPFPGWLEKPWFDTLKKLFAEAKRTRMRLWLFDDSHFPSGYADGRISPEHKKRLLVLRFYETAAPGKYIFHAPDYGPGNPFFRAVLAPFEGPNGFRGEEAKDVTSLVRTDGTLDLDLPAGRMRVFFMTPVPGAGEPGTRDYMNMIDPDATDEFINIVCETHYKHLKEYFEDGTFAGFFSDEPRFGSEASYQTLPGRPKGELPFSTELAERLADKDAAFWPSLWFDAGERTAEYRTDYMDAVSRLYSECFPQKMGRWCRAHNTAYIGHVIEDNGAHTRLGYGAGHYFRAMRGQSCAMIDSVLDQNLPGFTNGIHSSLLGPHDGSFFHWGLGKLASSAAHLMPEFNGCAAVECFGAYGWKFGIDSMKLQTDHFAVRGINHFVPHAFSNAPFPDADCPPHFYARGENPQWRFFARWRDYCSKVCELLSGGIHRAGFAILYHAEAEWSTRPFAPFHRTGESLMRRQLDYDVIPFDLLENAPVSAGIMSLGGEEFHTLIVPEYTYLPEGKKAVLNGLKTEGLHVVSEAAFHPEEYDSGIRILAGAGECLRVLRREKDGRKIFFFVNESTDSAIIFQLTDSLRNPVLLDVITGETFAVGPILLEAGESLFALEKETSPENIPVRPVSFAPAGIPVKEENGSFVFQRNAASERTYLDLGRKFHGAAEVELNGKTLPGFFAPPYRMEISKELSDVNTLKIQVIAPPSGNGCRNNWCDGDMPERPSPEPEILLLRPRSC